MKRIRSALLAAAMLAGVPSVALAQPDDGERGGRPVGPGRLERRPDAAPEQARTQFQPQQDRRQDFGSRQEFRGRGDQAQAPAAIQYDGQRPQGPGRFAAPDGRRGDFDRRPDAGNRPDNRQLNGRQPDNRAPNIDRRFDGNGQFGGDNRRFDDNNRFRGGDNRQFDNNNRFRGRDNRFDDNNRFQGNNRFQRDWRNDRRYDWRGYRNNNRQLFRAPRYLAPRGYGFGYRSFSRGYQLQPFFYGQNYWINDPWQYRLPPAYGSYRWVRYYNDVVLVDIYSGFVIDVIQNFFW